jgi:hypothetical protein
LRWLGAGSTSAHLVDYADDIDQQPGCKVTTVGVVRRVGARDSGARCLERLAEYGYESCSESHRNETLAFALQEIRPAQPAPGALAPQTVALFAALVPAAGCGVTPPIG